MSLQTLFTNAPATAMRMRSGGFFDLANPRASDVRLSDIACGLSRICRFAGQTRLWYSVAEHSVHAARLAQKRGYDAGFVRAVLLHDAAEAYVGDVIRPLRRMLPRHEEIERRVQAAIFERFGVDIGLLDDPRLRAIDDGLLVAEYAYLLGADGVQPGPEFLDVLLSCWHLKDARDEFLRICFELGIEY